MFKTFETEFTIDVSADNTYKHFNIFDQTLINLGILAPLSFSERLSRNLFEGLWKRSLKYQVPAGRYCVKTVRRGLSLSASLHPVWI